MNEKTELIPPPIFDEDDLYEFSDGDYQGFSVYANVITLWGADYDTEVFEILDQMPSKPLAVFKQGDQIRILWQDKDIMLQHGQREYLSKNGSSFVAKHWYKDEFCLVEFEGSIPTTV